MAKDKAKVIIPLGLGLGVVTALVIATRSKSAAPPVTPPGRASIFGKVSDSETGDAIAGALISLDGIQTYTDSSGNYALADLDSGSYTLILSKDGYTTLSGTVTLSEGSNQLNFQLNPELVPALPFTYTLTCGRLTCPPWPLYDTASFKVVIKNNNSQQVTRTVNIMWSLYSKTYGKWVSCGNQFVDTREYCLCKGLSSTWCFPNSRIITLAPGASKTLSYPGWCVYEGSQYCNPLLYLHYDYYFWVEDDAGGKSNEVKISLA